MSFGAPFGIPFGFAPPTNPAPDDPRTLLRRAPFDPNEAPAPTMAGGMPGGVAAPVGLLDAIMRPSAEQGGTAAAPPPNGQAGGSAPDFDAAFRTGRPGGGGGGSMSMADQYSLARGMTNLAGRMNAEPQAPPGQPQQPAQAPQQSTQAAAPPMVAPFSFAGAMPSAPMEVGGGRGFGPGSAGAGLPMPSGGDSLGTPASTGSIAGAQRAQAGRPLPFIGAPRATNPAASPMTASQDGAPLPLPRPTEFGGTGTWAQPEGPATAPQAAAGSGAPAAAGGPSFLERLGQGIGDNADLLTSIGMGLLSTRGLGQGVAVGLKNYQDQQSKKEATGIARAELGLRLQKAAQDATGLKGNQALVKAAFPDLTPEQLASSNPQLVTAAIAKLQNSNAGREMRADSNGVQRWVDSGQPVFAGDEGKSKWTQARTPDGGTILYDESDPSKNQVLIPGQPVRVATEEERRAYGIGPGQAVKMTPKDGPVLIGGSNTPQVKTFEQRDGSKVERQWDPATNTWAEPNYGANPPAAQAPTNPFATGKFNEGQGKAAGFTDRMMGSEQVLRDLEGINTGIAGGVAGAASSRTPNFMKTSDRQRFEQAQSDFINAQLRRESGAAIAETEFANARKQYLPQRGTAPT